MATAAKRAVGCPSNLLSESQSDIRLDLIGEIVVIDAEVWVQFQLFHFVMCFFSSFLSG